MPDNMYFKYWLDKANNDLLAAEAILGYYEEPPTDTICYHRRQIAEKCFKAFVIARANKLRKVHDLIGLHEACTAIDKDFEKFQEASENLNRYYIDSKYPALGPIWYPLAEAKTAVEQAREILVFTRKKLLSNQSETNA